MELRPCRGDAVEVPNDHSPTDAGPDDQFEQVLAAGGLVPEQGTWGWTPGRVLATALLVIVVGFWVWAFSPFAPHTHPDELDDPAWAAAAGPLCENAEQVLDKLPRASDARTLVERADQIDAGTAIYRSLLADLAAIAPAASTEDGVVVREWLADYGTYLDDRDRHSELLRSGIDQPFETTSKARRQITIPVDEFAKGNRIAACVTPQDV